jgi:hypothetical protein
MRCRSAARPLARPPITFHTHVRSDGLPAVQRGTVDAISLLSINRAHRLQTKVGLVRDRAQKVPSFVELDGRWRRALLAACELPVDCGQHPGTNEADQLVGALDQDGLTWQTRSEVLEACCWRSYQTAYPHPAAAALSSVKPEL